MRTKTRSQAQYTYWIFRVGLSTCRTELSAYPLSNFQIAFHAVFVVRFCFFNSVSESRSCWLLCLIQLWMHLLSEAIHYPSNDETIIVSCLGISWTFLCVSIMRVQATTTKTIPKMKWNHLFTFSAGKCLGQNGLIP